MTKAEQKTDTLERILDAAEFLFARHGFEGASTRQIASMAGVSIQTLHYHSGGKLELYHKALERSIMPLTRMINSHIQEMLRKDLNDDEVLKESLNSLIDELFDILSQNPNSPPLFFRQWLEEDADLRRVEWESLAPYLRKWIMQVESSIDADRRSGIDLPLSFMSLSLIYWGLFTNHKFQSALVNLDSESKEYMERVKLHAKEMTARVLGRGPAGNPEE